MRISIVISVQSLNLSVSHQISIIYQLYVNCVTQTHGVDPSIHFTTRRYKYANESGHIPKARQNKRISQSNEATTVRPASNAQIFVELATMWSHFQRGHNLIHDSDIDVWICTSVAVPRRFRIISSTLGQREPSRSVQALFQPCVCFPSDNVLVPRTRACLVSRTRI